MSSLLCVSLATSLASHPPSHPPLLLIDRLHVSSRRVYTTWYRRISTAGRTCKCCRKSQSRASSSRVRNIQCPMHASHCPSSHRPFGTPPSLSGDNSPWWPESPAPPSPPPTCTSQAGWASFPGSDNELAASDLHPSYIFLPPTQSVTPAVASCFHLSVPTVHRLCTNFYPPPPLHIVCSNAV